MDFFDKGKAITSCQVVWDKLKKDHDVEFSLKSVSEVLKKEMGLRFRKTKKVVSQINSERCLILRQQYALSMLSLLKQDKRIINVDETWLNESSFLRKTWVPKNSTGSVPLKTITPSLSMIAALDTDGRVYFSLSHSNTD